MTQRKMNLAAFVVAGPVSGHHGGWRYPTSDRDLLSLDYYRNIGRILEDGRFDLIFFADILAIPNRYEGKLDSQLRYGALGSLRLDPMLVLSAMAATTKHLGLASTISTSYFHPYAVARAMATLDHLSGGRAAWNIVTSFQQAEAANFGLRISSRVTSDMNGRTNFSRSPASSGIAGATAPSSSMPRSRNLPTPKGLSQSTTVANGSMCADRSMSAARRKDGRFSSRRAPPIAAATSPRAGRKSSSSPTLRSIQRRNFIAT